MTHPYKKFGVERGQPNYAPIGQHVQSETQIEPET